MGNFLTMANETEDEDTDHEAIGKITDATKLMTEAIYQSTLSRKLSAEPRFSKFSKFQFL